MSLLGQEKVDQINALDPAERFARVSNRAKFKCKGLSSVLNRFRDVARFTQLLQTISQSPDLMAEYKKKFSFQRLLDEFIMAIGIDSGKLELSPEEQQQQQAEQQRMQQQQQMLLAMQAQGKQKPGPKPQPDFENLNPAQNPENVGGGAGQVNAEAGGLR